MNLHLDWIGGGAALLSMWLVGKKQWTGWAIGAATHLLFVWLNYRAGYIGLIPLSVCAFFLSVRNGTQWRRGDHK